MLGLSMACLFDLSAFSPGARRMSETGFHLFFGIQVGPGCAQVPFA